MHTWMKYGGFALAFACGCNGVCNAAPPQARTGIDVIRAYEGSWNIAIEHFDTAQSKAGRESKSLRNDCWKSAGYFACNQFVDGESRVLLIFTYDAKSNVYASYQIPTDGSEPGAGKLLIDGNVWTYPWQQGEGDKTIWFRVVNVFSAPDRIEFRQEFSTDKVHWTVMAKGQETKAAGQ